MAKLGPHLQGVSDPAMAWARRAPIVKQMMSTTALKASQDGAIKVFRWYQVTEPLSDPAGHAAEIVRALAGYHHPNLFVELYNEIDQDRPQLDDYITWTELASNMLHASGYKVAGFSFSTGNPTVYPDAWEYLRSRNYGGVDAISMHEYWNGRTGAFSGWNALRYRKVHEWTGGQHPPLLITECGADAVEGGPSGWKLCGITGAQYVQQLARYETELAKDDYVLGAVVFGGAPGPDWTNFSTDDLDTSRFSGLPPRTNWTPTNGGGSMTIEELVAKNTPPGLFQPVTQVAPGYRVAFSNVENEIIFELDGVAQAVQGKPNPKA